MHKLILLHGALGTAADMDALATRLRQNDIEVICHTFSGHGNRVVSGDFGIPVFCAELKELIRQSGSAPVSVFGYSMGGYVALCLALQEPGLFRRIITLGTKFDWSESSVAKETRQLDPDVILQKVPAFAAVLEQKHGTGWKDLLTATAAMMSDIGKANRLNDGALGSLPVPVWLGLGDRDQMVSLEETRHVFKQLPKACMYMVPGSKHPMEAVDQDLLAANIVRMLDL